ncbi:MULTISPECIES: ORF6N domain-containing protein [Xenorhabdus]|uniref:ORF6N domain-containing protein n=1 Tax=Xenorhabdus TaxID=626 RepID=UPI00064ACC59|nr:MULTISPECIES: ORF6N domain-containing protein [Xenorhabdus]KLU14706.1 hypothetical protein AAY47_14845 [Xenorhabdus griffiniae]KOP31663.1 hypothetical protein AFK69_19725 [Xenorhabdus sp. GDc328]
MTNQISVESLSIVAFKNIPVVTTELLACLYGTEPDYIRKNHNRNLERFVIGKHYFLLESDELREFKHRMSLRPSVENSNVAKSNFVKIAKNVRSLILWTERGAARHAKMLETDQAWDVFEKLEDFYFNQNELESVANKTKPRLSTASQLTPLRQAAERLITTGLGKIYPDIWKLVHEHFEVKHIYQLEPAQITEAVEFLNALEGEYIPKQTSILDANLLPDNGKVLVTLQNRKIQDYQTVDPNSHVMTLNTFMELAQKAGYLIIHKESFSKIVNQW